MMSIQLVPSFSFQKYTLWYFFFSLIVFCIGLLLALYSILFCLLWCLFVFSYFIIHYIKSLPLESLLYADRLSIGAFVLLYDDIKSYRLITRVVGGVPCLYGICIKPKVGKSYYYSFRGSPSSIKKRVAMLDQHIPRSQSSSPSLYEEIIDITKI